MIKEIMIGKKEIYVGLENEKYNQILQVLCDLGIKYNIRTNTEEHAADINRGVAVGRFVEKQYKDKRVVRIYISRHDYDKAMGEIKLRLYEL